MNKRSSLELKKEILNHIKKHGETSLKMLEIKLKSGFRSINIQVKELEFFGAIELIYKDKNPNTGRPSTSVVITDFGKKLIN